MQTLSSCAFPQSHVSQMSALPQIWRERERDRERQTDFLCEEIFGMDLMLDKKMKVWMCEVNTDPGLGYPDKEDTRRHIIYHVDWGGVDPVQCAPERASFCHLGSIKVEIIPWCTDRPGLRSPTSSTESTVDCDNIGCARRLSFAHGQHEPCSECFIVFLMFTWPQLGRRHKSWFK